MLFWEISQPRKAKDPYALALWKRHGLGKNPSTLQIHPVAMRLLGNPDTRSKLDGMSMFLGREVHLRDPLSQFLCHLPEEIVKALKALPEIHAKPRWYQTAVVELVDSFFG